MSGTTCYHGVASDEECEQCAAYQARVLAAEVAMSETKHTPPEPWSARFEEHGGYDCITSGWVVRDAQGREIVTVDCGRFGQETAWDGNPAPLVAEEVARLIASAPALAAENERLRGALRKIAELAGPADADAPIVEDYDDTESAYGNGVDVGTWEAGQIARAALDAKGKG